MLDVQLYEVERRHHRPRAQQDERPQPRRALLLRDPPPDNDTLDRPAAEHLLNAIANAVRARNYGPKRHTSAGFGASSGSTSDDIRPGSAKPTSGIS